MQTTLMITKRSGAKEPFVIDKVLHAIEAANAATGTTITKEGMALVLQSVETICEFIVKTEPLTVEKIQDIVESTLMQHGFYETAKAYILYRDHHSQQRLNPETNLDYKKLVDSYIEANDWRVKENATVSYSIGGLILSNSGAVSANYWLSEIYDEEIANAHRNADMHIHDLSMLTGYCAGWSLKQLLLEGIHGPAGRICSAPAKHLATLCNQMVNFIGIMQNEWAGAQALSSFDTYLAPFVKEDNLTYTEVKQCIQSFVYGVNIPSRWGTQAPFTNITLDWVVPEDLADLPCIVGGKPLSYTYKECQREVDLVNKAFLEIMLEGDSSGRGFQYPIPTYSITEDFDWSDTENNRLLFKLTAKFGTPYFSNYINSDMKPSDVRAMCCRLRLDLRELRKASGGGYFGSGENTGSIGVVTLNLPRLAYNSVDLADYIGKLRRLTRCACKSLDLKRKQLNEFMARGLYPYTSAYLNDFSHHFSTIGVVGMNEACLNAKWINCNIETEKGKSFAENTLDIIKQELTVAQEQYGALFNLEATPAESTSYRLAKHDIELFGDNIIHSGTTESPYYTNSTQLPVNTKLDLFDALDHQDSLQTRYTSGTVFHTFLGEQIESWSQTAKLVRTIANNYKLPYYTISPIYSVCPLHGYIAGDHKTCPKCGNSTEVYSRITGYYRPVANWNAGKTQEYKERALFDNNIEPVSYTVPETQSKQKPLHEIPQPKQETANQIMLVTRKNCPNCKLVRKILDNIEYQEISADEPNNECFIQENSIMSAPTILVMNGSEILRKITSVSECSKFAKEFSK